MKKGFFAYSSHPSSCGEAIESAIEEINKAKVVNIMPWTKLLINGRLIINEVVREISGSDFFCADLTGLNDNVLFEIGYAIGLNKPIWLIFDTSHIDSYRRNRETNFFNTIGYQRYSKTSHIVDSFYSEPPYNKNGSYDELTKNVTPIEDNLPLLFLKNQVDTNYNDYIVKSIKAKKLTCALDDASETKTQSISWYLSRLLSVPAVLAEFSTSSRAGYEVQNSKCSLISGLSLGLDLKLLMVCEKPYNTPLDYKELLKQHGTVSECKENTEEFLYILKQNYFEWSQRRLKFTVQRRKVSALQNINFGEYLAEHENNRLQSYYVETTELSSFIKDAYNIVIGRKGSGKTAALFYLQNYLENDPRNHVCVIKPISFELEGLLYAVSKTPDNFEKSYLIESAWKFLIYTEIAKAIYETLKDKLLCATSDKERRFISFIEDNKEIFFTDFYERIDERLTKVNESVKDSNKEKLRVKVSEIFHMKFLPQIRKHILDIYDKNRNIYILIDNLDKSWGKDSQIEYQSRWILGLLKLPERIIKEFASSRKDNKTIEIHLTLFLRSDIFYHIQKYAKEPDKIKHTKIRIEDKETLFRIINERFVTLSKNNFVYEDLWKQYMPKSIKSVNVQSYIYDRIIPRPRDIIFFFNKIKNIAISRGHIKFLEEDVEEAYKEYSDWVFSSILVENGITIEQMENFLYELAGENQILTRENLLSKAKMVKIDFQSDEGEEKFIDHLVSLSILGREIKQGDFSFDYNFESNKKMQILARKLGTYNYKIHNALVSALGCVT